MISIIIPFRDKAGLLKKCLSSILGKTKGDFEIILVDNNSRKEETKKYLHAVSKNEKIRIIGYKKSFNFSAINNFAAAQAKGELLLFLNNDTEVINLDWLEKMAGLFEDEKTGAVGAKLFYPDGRIQHAGIKVGKNIAANVFNKRQNSDLGKYDRIRTCDAVTGACLMTRRGLFLEIGGFDEINLPVAYNDVDYCLKLREKGFVTLWTPEARLYHIESASRPVDDTFWVFIFNPKRYKLFREEQDYMSERWGLTYTNFSTKIKKLAEIKITKRKFPESRLAHKYLDDLSGLEIGGSAHNPFGLKTRNVDFTDSMETTFKKQEKELCGEAMPVDIMASGDNLPVPDESQDFVISSHVLEHFPDPIKALKEWHRVIKKGGYIFMIVPHKERTFDKHKKRTRLQELIDCHKGLAKAKDSLGHYSFWITEDLVELMDYLGWKIVEAWDVDDKAGNGFIIVIQKTDKSHRGEKAKIFKPSLSWKIKNRINIILRSHRVSLNILKE